MSVIELGIDLGSSSTSIFRLNKGLVLKEASRVLFEITDRGKVVREVGNKAERLQGRTPQNMQVVAPVVDGEIVDVEMASRMLKKFVRMVTADDPKAKITALLNVPCGASAEECKRFKDVAYSAGISVVRWVPTALASAIGAGFELNSAQSAMIVDIGGGCTDIAVIGLGNIIHGLTLNIGSQHIDKSIAEHILNKCNVQLSLKTSRLVKEEIGSLLERDNADIEVSGVEVEKKDVQKITVTSMEVKEAITDYYDLICDSIESVISACTNDIVESIHKWGVIACGNGAQIVGLERFMQNRLNMPVNVIEGNVTAFGLGVLLGNKKLLGRLLR